MSEITDEEMMTAVASSAPVSPERVGRYSFTVVDVVRGQPGTMLVRFTIEGEPGLFGVQLPLPSSDALKPWLYGIPENAQVAAQDLLLFLEEEVATGCAGWAVTTVADGDRLFQLEPYGFRTADERRHRRLVKSAGPDGWNGRIQENDEASQTPRALERTRLAALPFSYAEVGATSGELPPGYRTVSVSRQLGTGQRWFEEAVQRLMTWDMHRRAGILVLADGLVTAGSVAVLEVGFGGLRVSAPVRVVEVVDEPGVCGFAYGTLPGHPESGEERFLVHLDADGTVRGEIRAFSRPGSWLTRLGGPVARRVQATVTERYLVALSFDPALDVPAVGDSGAD